MKDAEGQGEEVGDVKGSRRVRVGMGVEGTGSEGKGSEVKRKVRAGIVGEVRGEKVWKGRGIRRKKGD